MRLVVPTAWCYCCGMLPTAKGSIRLFQVFGITVFLHWSWFLVAVIEFQNRGSAYSSVLWNAVEYLTLFAIVLLHEFGHALACRQVGGKAETILLWPLGGVALVSPPPRPGPMLWSVAAGPLVNLVLIVPLFALSFYASANHLQQSAPDLFVYIKSVAFINLVLLIFNLLPAYPLDGGQILRSLLWFLVGPARSLVVATVIGLVASCGLLLLALFTKGIWLGIIGVFMLFACWRGFMQARVLLARDKLPRHAEYKCPSCGRPPVIGPAWLCPNCGNRFDTFESGATCPGCRTQFQMTQCLDCGANHSFSEWAEIKAKG